MNKEFLYNIYSFCYPGNLLRMPSDSKFSSKGALLKSVKINTYGGASSNHICIESGVRMKNCRFDLFGSGCEIVIEKNCILENVNFWLEDTGSRISIGEGTTLGKTHLAAIEGKGIMIGKDCMLSSEITFQTGDAHSVTDMDGNRINPAADIVLGNHVWVGKSVLCEKGSQIADNSIIGAGAVVNKRFDEENVVIAGMPARIVKRKVNWKRERI